MALQWGLVPLGAAQALMFGPLLSTVLSQAPQWAAGIASGLFATEIIARSWPGAETAILSGPSFAEDIGRGLPTAVTLAMSDEARALAACRAGG